MQLKRENLSKTFPKPTMSDIIRHRPRENPWPCDRCDGIARIVRPGEVPDPVEGHRQSVRIDCPKCNGTGRLDEKYYNELLKEEIKIRNEREKKRIALQKKAKAIFAKISEEELAIILSYATDTNCTYDKVAGWPKPKQVDRWNEDEL